MAEASESEWAFLPYDHNKIRDWAEEVYDDEDFSDADKAIALRFVAYFAYYSDGYNVAVTFYKPDADPLVDTEEHDRVRDFIDRLVAKNLARVVFRFENDIHQTLGLKLGRRVCSRAYKGAELMA